jgi:hypothetical protein
MRLIRLSGLFLLCAVAVNAQTNKGGIKGSVLDANGAAVPGATVTITNLGTNQSTKVNTSETGAYSVSSLEPVTYSVIVEHSGFKKSIVEKVKVDTATIVTSNVTLETGAVAETVTVTADAPLINTESGATTQTVTERQIRDVPLANRSVLDLAVTAPNVSGDAGSEDPEVTSGQPVPGFNLNLNGGRSGSTAILADGVNNTGVGIARAVVSFTPETVQEFTVQTSAYSAEYGNTGGEIKSSSDIRRQPPAAGSDEIPEIARALGRGGKECGHIQEVTKPTRFVSKEEEGLVVAVVKCLAAFAELRKINRTTDSD